MTGGAATTRSTRRRTCGCTPRSSTAWCRPSASSAGASRRRGRKPCSASGATWRSPSASPSATSRPARPPSGSTSTPWSRTAWSATTPSGCSSTSTGRRSRPPPRWPLPDPAWSGLALPTAAVLRRVGTGALPPVLRERFGLPWSAADERRFRAFAAALRTADRGMVGPLRYSPIASRALLRARLRR
ncbi:hypothetical protein DMH08_13695 [Actinomadura sp. WAC 06369]|nr:hypothetical protein DMH08_13695 [Actinomadura sp. WAC 06369]